MNLQLFTEAALLGVAAAVIVVALVVGTMLLLVWTR